MADTLQVTTKWVQGLRTKYRGKTHTHTPARARTRPHTHTHTHTHPPTHTHTHTHTCRHPRRDVEGLVTASHCNAQLTCQDCCNHSCTAAITLTCWISAGTSLSVPSDILTTYRPALLAEESVWAPLPPACKHVNIETWKKVLPWITGLYTHTHAPHLGSSMFSKTPEAHPSFNGRAERTVNAFKAVILQKGTLKCKGFHNQFVSGSHFQIRAT